MNRKEREITDRALIDDIIRRGQVCRLAMCRASEPYVVPLSYGYAGNGLYFHPAREGRKLEFLRANPRVCFEIDIDHELKRADQACGWGMKYRSVIGYGNAVFVAAPAEKRKALDVLMRHYAGEGQTFSYPDASVDSVTVVRVDIECVTGKQCGY
jgi:uncharacterized protein